MQPEERSAPEHVTPLPGGEWAIWRTFAVRSPGFSVDLLEGLATPGVARAVDELSGRPARSAELERLRRLFDDEMRRVYDQLWSFHDDPRFREAVAWQNRSFLDRLGRGERGSRPTSDEKRNLRTLALYMQRYCVKNDTIGFFGPVGWGTVVDVGPGVEVRPGPALVAARRTYIENWAVRSVAAAFAKRLDAHAWLRPRLSPFLDVVDAEIHVPFRSPMPVGPALAAALRMCDGTRTEDEICTAVAADPALGVASAEDLRAQLRMAEQLSAISYEPRLPLGPEPESTLRALVAASPDEAFRKAALDDLDDLCARKAELSAAAGDAAAVHTAMQRAEASFRRITETDATRRGGETYASRTIAYEDCRRDISVRVGPPLLATIGPALSLALDSARWFSWHVMQKYRAVIEARYEELAPREPLPLVELFGWFRKNYMRDGVIELTEAVQELQRRWLEVIPTAGGSHHSSDLRARAVEVFAAPAVGWPGAYFAPDVMIAATDGALLGVLGEMHYHNTLRHPGIAEQHPDVGSLCEALARDYPEPNLAAVPSGESYRLALTMIPPHDFQVQLGDEPPSCDPGRVVRLGELRVVRDGGRLSAVTRDGRATFPAEAFLGLWLQATCSRAQIGMFPVESRRARITVDNLVIARAAWRLSPRDLAFVREKDELRRFIAARRLREELQLPRRVFARARTESKPVYVDFDAPILVDTLARMVRKDLESDAETSLVVTEMLPDVSECWLKDAAGRPYAAELRIAALERQRRR